MKLPSKFLLSDLIEHRVRCDKGLDHGSGVYAWMYPSFHRLLGWVTSPSNFKISREVWRLDQLKGYTQNELYVKGLPSITDQKTLDRCPTLINAHVFNTHGEKIGLIADFVFEPNKGKILYYLISRSNPLIPGSSRWRLDISHIIDQQAGSIASDLKSLEDLPIYKASIKEEFLNKSRQWRQQFQDIRFRASDRLEGWLEENDVNPYENEDDSISTNFSDDWIDNEEEENFSNANTMDRKMTDYNSSDRRDFDPWV